MAIAEIRPGLLPPPVNPEGIFSPKLYLTPNQKGVDIITSPFPRAEHVAAHERAGLEFLTMDQELSRGVKLWIGPNSINKFTASVMFEHIRRPDAIGLSEYGIIMAEGKTSEGEVFANEARTKIELLPRFVERLMDNRTLFTSNLRVWFSGNEDILRKLPVAMRVQPAYEMDLIFFTQHPENEEILNKIGRGQFRSVSHRVVEIPNRAAKAA